MSGQIYNQKNLSKEYLKIRWKEPYVSDALNKKMFGVFSKGVYAGFVISPGVGIRDINVGPGSVSGGFGTGMTGSYVSGGFDESVGYSIAVQQSTNGYNKTIVIPPGINSNFTLDATGRDGERVYVVLDSTYSVGNESSVRCYLTNGEYIDEDPSVIVLGHVDVPAAPLSPITNVDIGYNDPTYPRLTPLANPQKAGFMPTSVWEKLDQFFAWEDLCKPSLSISSFSTIEIKPSQRKTSNKRIYTYVAPTKASKFPRDATGKYNGGVNNDQVALVDIKAGTIGGAHQIPGNSTFAIASVSGTADAFQIGLVSIDQADQVHVEYGSVYMSMPQALDQDNFPSVGGDRMPICYVLIETDSLGDIKNMNTTYSIMDARQFLNTTGGAPAIEEKFLVGVGGETNFSVSGFLFSEDNAIPDIAVYVNGKREFQALDGNPANGSFIKLSGYEIEFTDTVSEGAEVVIHHERGSGSGTSANLNLNNITTNPAPDISGNRSLGLITKGWKSLYLKDTASSQVYEVKVVSGIIQVVPVP